MAVQQVSQSDHRRRRAADILHLNGYKISNPTLLARIDSEELEQFFKGCGWTPYFVEGDEPEAMHQLMAGAMDQAIEDIREIRENARNRNGASLAALAHDRSQVPQGMDRTENRRRVTGRGHIPLAPGAAAR